MLRARTSADEGGTPTWALADPGSVARILRILLDNALRVAPRGSEIKVILINHGPEDFIVRRGDRIAQLLIAPVVQASWRETDALEETARGQGGFGSTGAV